MRVLLCGQRSFGAAVLRALREGGHDVAAVCCPDGCKTHEAASLFGVRVIRSGSLTAGSVPAGTDIIVCAHSHDFLGTPTRLRARLGAIGYHPSLLPRHRGRDAVRWTVRMREPIAGGTVYRLDHVMDGGPIVLQDWCHVAPGETASDLWRHKLFGMGVRMLTDAVANADELLPAANPQDERYATFEPAMDPPRAFRPELPRIELIDGGDGYPWASNRTWSELHGRREGGG